MKKIFSLSVLLVFSLFVSLVSASYNPNTQKATFKFTKGWNLYPILPDWGEDNTCIENKEGPPKIFAYIYSALTKKYILVGPDSNKKIEEEQQTYGTKGKHYLYSVGAWFYYTKKDCEASISYKSTGFSNYLDIVKGWQFVAKHTFMKDYSVTFADCTIEKFNQWDNVKKGWKFRPSVTSVTKLESLFNSAEVGEVFVIKFASECTLGYRIEDVLGIPAPPALE